MTEKSVDRLVIAVSSRALFNLEDSNRVFENEGREAYIHHQIERETEVLAPGVAFPLVSKLMALNRGGTGLPHVEVILISRNNADTGLRILHSLEHHKLEVTRAAFTTGRAPYRYAQAFGSHLFLSAHGEDVRAALEAGMAAAAIHPGGVLGPHSDEIRIAFDGDAVLFSDESERVYKAEGLEAFRDHERQLARTPMDKGPFAAFLDALHRIQSARPGENAPIRTALITARGGVSAQRVIHTLRVWGIRIDEAVFLDGLDKGEFLQAFGADIFFDDQAKHVASAGRFVNAAHVTSGVANE